MQARRDITVDMVIWDYIDTMSKMTAGNLHGLLKDGIGFFFSQWLTDFKVEFSYGTRILIYKHIDNHRVRDFPPRYLSDLPFPLRWGSLSLGLTSYSQHWRNGNRHVFVSSSKTIMITEKLDSLVSLAQISDQLSQFLVSRFMDGATKFEFSLWADAAKIEFNNGYIGNDLISYINSLNKPYDNNKLLWN